MYLQGIPPLSSFGSLGPGNWKSGNISPVNQLSISTSSNLLFDVGRTLYLMTLGKDVSDGKVDVNTTPPHTDRAIVVEFSEVKAVTNVFSSGNAET